MRGNASSPPLWGLILEVAHGDPLRAQEIEERVNAEWWTRYLAWREAHAHADDKNK